MPIKNKPAAMEKLLPIAIVLLLLAVLIALGGCQPNQNQNPDANQEETQPDSTTANSGKILLVTDEYQPYTSSKLPDNGAFTQIIAAVMNETGLAYEIRFYPWDRGSEMVKNGEAWATFPYSYQERLAQNCDYSDAVMKSRYLFYYLAQNQQLAKDGQNFTAISDFKNYTFGGTNGYWYGDKATIENLGVTAEWASDTDALIKMLYAGRIDFFVEDEQVADAAIKRLFPNDTGAFAKLPAVAAYQTYYLVISRNYPATADIKNKFNAALKKLTDDGTINRILTENGIPSY